MSLSIHCAKLGQSLFRARTAICFWMLALAGLSESVFAQSISGTILGTVKDPSGKTVSQAKVQLTNKGTDAQRVTLTSESGDFRFGEVEAGVYVLVIEAPGFQKEEFAQFELLARETRRLDTLLKLATQTQTVNVEESMGALIQTDTSNVSRN